MKRKISFLCSFGGIHGWGHLVRSSAVAQTAKMMGWYTILVAEGPGDSIPKEILESFEQRLFVPSFEEFPNIVISSDVVFFDFMYRKDEFYHTFRNDLEVFGKRNTVLVATDDMQNRSMDAVDIVVNPEVGLNGDVYPKVGKQLLGERFAYLRRGFSDMPSRRFKLDLKNPIPVFVMIGGTDPWNLSVPVLRELAEIEGITFSPILLSGEQMSKLSELRECLDQFPSARWLCSLSSGEMAALMISCAFGIIACGSSIFEMAALNVPFVGLSIVDNQTATARKIRKKWGLPILHLEDREEGKCLGVASAVEHLLNDYSQFEDPYSSVDSKGGERIMEAITDCLEN